MQRILVLIAVLALAGSLACDSGSDITSSTDPDLSSLSSDAFAVVDAEDAFAGFEGATLDSAMAMNPAFQASGGFSRKSAHPRDGGSHLGPILVDLGLDATQRQQIRALIRTQRETVRPLLDSIRTLNADVIAQANQDRQAIVDAYRAGTISGDDARAQIVDLNEATQDAIRNNPDNAPILDQICNTRRALFGRIRAILTEDQAADWDAWVASLADDCLAGD